MLIIFGRCLGVLELGGVAPEIVIFGGTSSTVILFEGALGSKPLLALVPNELL